MISRAKKNKNLKKQKKRELKKEKRIKRKKFLKRMAILLFLFIVLIILYSRFFEINFLVIHENKITNEKIPDNFNGLKIVHFSDLHYGRIINKNNLSKIVNKINSLEADIVIFTGDLVDNGYQLTSDDVNVLTKNLTSIDYNLGKYSIIGNHDYHNKNYDNIMYDSGFMILKNTYDTIYNDNQNPILIYGFDNYTYGNPSTKGLKDEKIIDIKYKIGLVHEGDYIDEFINDDEIDLVLAGHSHNAQINIPFIKQFLLPEGSKKYYENYYKINNKDIFISNGIGTSRMNFRLFSFPSINFYRLNNK